MVETNYSTDDQGLGMSLFVVKPAEFSQGIVVAIAELGVQVWGDSAILDPREQGAVRTV